MKTSVLIAILVLPISTSVFAQTANEHRHGGSSPTVQTTPPQPSPPAAQAPKPAAGQQNPHTDHGAHAPSGDPAKPIGDMTGMMRKMLPMMESMQKPGTTPVARAEMMKQMAPMMQQMMPMMRQLTENSPAPAGVAPQTNANTADYIRENMVAMEKMHGPMNKGIAAANPDEAFVRGMIPHHQGAIDMAIIVLKYGKDEQVRKWATDVIREQQREITEMEGWLRKFAK